MVDDQLSAAIMSLLNERPATASICPSEAARLVGTAVGGRDSGRGRDGDLDVDVEGWRELMEPARAAARRLVNDGSVEITQGGKVVDPSTAKGPIRIRKKRTS
jgi:Protein of unknown function (DUF3253)